MKVLGCRLDHCVALGIERDDGDRIPVSGMPCPAPRVFCPCALVQLPRPMPVHVRELGSAHHLDPEVRKLPLAAAQPVLDLPQAVSASQPAENHRDELLPAALAQRMPLGIEPAHLALEVRAQNKLKNPTEQAAKSVRAEPPRCGPKRLGTRCSLHGKAPRFSR